MAHPTHAEILAHLANLASPPGGLGTLHYLAERLCVVQQALKPVTTPRRLVLFAADHGPDAESRVGTTIHHIADGGAATAVVAKSTHTELVLVDVGSRADALPESPRYRSRKVRPGSRDFTKQPALTVDEFRTAFVVGQKEAEQSHADGMRLVAVDALGAESAHVAGRVRAVDADRTDDLMGAWGAVGGADVAAVAGFIARAVELGLTVLIEGDVARAGLHVTERLYPGTAAKVVEAEPPPPSPLPEGGTEPNTTSAKQSATVLSPSPFRGGVGEGFQTEPLPTEGLSALLVFPLLDAAVAVVVRAARREEPERDTRAKPARKVAVFTGSFDPPTTYHRRVATLLRGCGFDEVVVRPTGPRCDTPETEHAKPVHRAVMADLAFRDLPGVTVDLSDLDDAVFTPHYSFNDLLADRGEVWHVIPAEFVVGGRTGESAIHTKWELGLDAWTSHRFVVLHSPEAPPDPADLPPVCRLVAVDGHVATEDIRLRVFQGGSPRPDVTDDVEEYIRRYRLFTGMSAPRETRVRLGAPRLKIVTADKSEKALRAAEPFRKLESSDPTHILVLGGDGTMLQAIRDYWRLRLPFLGLNAGTLGFLMNESLPPDPDGTEIVLYRMPMIRVDAELPDGKRVQSLAFADAWVERDSGQAAWLKIEVDGKTQVPRVVGDGLLVATPAGSSAYARAMGATSVPLTAPVFTLAGSNVFRPRFWKPVALPETTSVGFTSLDHNGKRPIRGFIDGHLIGAVKSMHVRVSTVAMVELGFTPEFDLSARLLRSMFPPSDPL
ncbi:putative inorganic polyphosphate/ATP-NAD kinase [Gemmata sp. SH-PL17]|uniref:nicotinate-nucleotide--dimethylbenzimidazole phosphoribosyltransferase n=1 Tax=Gemmata sp. SH-PL17 TaxID=1630693 RepID=UPI00078E37A9|nr:nicotinate-nucleotide--dimethylbenzimidazole phosphoribosyltransferase [Gemmata sp. SH-PL17]AMV29201.1 putative inorganic polyphosphate/ATP-NAD kinase [Gemmata sp. SH-PL17]